MKYVCFIINASFFFSPFLAGDVARRSVCTYEVGFTYAPFDPRPHPLHPSGVPCLLASLLNYFIASQKKDSHFSTCPSLLIHLNPHHPPHPPPPPPSYPSKTVSSHPRPSPLLPLPIPLSPPPFPLHGQRTSTALQRLSNKKVWEKITSSPVAILVALRWLSSGCLRATHYST